MLTNDDFETFVRKPFVVRATQITEENIDDIAKMIGEVRTDKGEKFIAINRRIVPTVGRAFLGWWITVFNGEVRCYKPKVFKDQFKAPAEDGVFSFTVEPVELDLPYMGN